MSGKNSAEYYRNRRAQHRMKRERQGIPLRAYSDFTQLPKYVQAGKELAMFDRLPDLPWPRTLFGNNVATMAEQRPVNRDTDCICGNPHRQLIPWTHRSLYGSGWTIEYFCRSSCKSKAVAQVQS